jgi:hypothetical protein
VSTAASTACAARPAVARHSSVWSPSVATTSAAPSLGSSSSSTPPALPSSKRRPLARAASPQSSADRPPFPARRVAAEDRGSPRGTRAGARSGRGRDAPVRFGTLFHDAVRPSIFLIETPSIV